MNPERLGRERDRTVEKPLPSHYRITVQPKAFQQKALYDAGEFFLHIPATHYEEDGPIDVSTIARVEGAPNEIIISRHELARSYNSMSLFHRIASYSLFKEFLTQHPNLIGDTLAALKNNLREELGVSIQVSGIKRSVREGARQVLSESAVDMIFETELQQRIDSTDDEYLQYLVFSHLLLHYKELMPTSDNLYYKLQGLAELNDTIQGLFDKLEGALLQSFRQLKNIRYLNDCLFALPGSQMSRYAAKLFYLATVSPEQDRDASFLFMNLALAGGAKERGDSVYLSGNIKTQFKSHTVPWDKTLLSYPQLTLQLDEFGIPQELYSMSTLNQVLRALNALYPRMNMVTPITTEKQTRGRSIVDYKIIDINGESKNRVAQPTVSFYSSVEDDESGVSRVQYLFYPRSSSMSAHVTPMPVGQDPETIATLLPRPRYKSPSSHRAVRAVHRDAPATVDSDPALESPDISQQEDERDGREDILLLYTNSLEDPENQDELWARAEIFWEGFQNYLGLEDESDLDEMSDIYLASIEGMLVLDWGEVFEPEAMKDIADLCYYFFNQTNKLGETLFGRYLYVNTVARGMRSMEIDIYNKKSRKIFETMYKGGTPEEVHMKGLLLYLKTLLQTKVYKEEV
jgi:hypothetical protein